MSPINEQCRALRTALADELARAGMPLPVYWGNRNWAPRLVDTMAEMMADGVTNALAVATSAFSSYSSCRQYLDDISRAREALGPKAPQVEKLPPFWNHPAFIDTMVANTSAALGSLGSEQDAEARATTRLVFTAHSLPMAMAASCDYALELSEASTLVAKGVGEQASAGPLAWDLVYQSRSGAPSDAWLEPSVVDHLRVLSDQGTKRVVLVPIGFVSDHMEVKYDLDIEAATAAKELGLSMARASTVGTAEKFVGGLAELVLDRINATEPKVVGSLPARPFPCSTGCCEYKK